MCGWVFYAILIGSQFFWCKTDSSILLNIKNIGIKSNETMYTDNEVFRISEVLLNNGTDSSTNYAILRHGTCQNDSDCPDEHHICAGRICICQQYYESNENNQCVQCPAMGYACTSCCGYSTLTCLSHVCTCTSEVCQGAQGVFITAQQIALSAALIMGFAALAMVIYRLCTKPRYLTARQRAAQRASESVSVGNTSYLRASLTSIQIRVLSRLRDRPPTYDNQQNNRNGSQRPSVTPPTQQNPPESPPPYDDGDRGLDTHLPPPYSELILRPDGFINPAYENETNVTITRLNDDEQPKTVIENSAK